MTYKEAQIAAYTDVSANSEAVIKTMLKNYSEAKATIKAEIGRLYATLAGVKPEDWYVTVIKLDRLNTLYRAVNDNFSKYASLSNQQTEDLICDSMRDMYYRTQYIHAAFMPEVITLTVLPEAFVRAVCTGQAAAVKQITKSIIDRFGSLDSYFSKVGDGTLTKLIAKNDLASVAEIQQTVTQALIQGKGIRELSENIEQCFQTIQWKATRIARTESLRASSTGQYAYTQDLESAGIKTQKMWIHVLSTRGENREAHEHLDGKIIDADAKFRSNGHYALYPRGFGVPSEDINCRCTYINIVNGVTPELRTAYNPNTGDKEIFTFRDYDTWKKENNIR